jgi:hypothetical protein
MTNFLKWLRRENQWMRKLRLSKGLHNALFAWKRGGCIPCFPALLDARLPFTWLVSGTAVMLPSDLFVFGVVRAILGEIRINITATGWTWVGLE